MKTAFSTLGCPNWSFSEIYAAAKDIGYDGIEIRGIGKDLYAPDMPLFSKELIESTKRKFEGRLKISCLTSAACLGVRDGAERHLKEAEDYLMLAGRLGVPCVRLLISETTYPVPVDLDFALERYRGLCDFALERGISALPLLETNGALADSSVMRALIDAADRPNAGVLWDINHPYRYFGESVEQTARTLGGRIKYMHVKDSHAEDGEIRYRMMGYGDMPVYDALRAAAAEGFDGYVCLEWVKRWMPELQEPGIVFSHYYNYIKYLFDMLGEEGK